MLSISQAIRGGGGYYAGGGAEDYYASGGREGQGTWWGEVAIELGLTGPVTAEALANVLSGLSPGGTVALVQNARDPTRQQGWDFTFSMPKSASVLWSQLPERWQREIEQIQEMAVRKALAYLEDVAGFTRRGQLGESLERSKLLFALFPHLVSRENDPQLHTHCVLVNLSLRGDRSTGTLWSRELFRHKMAAGALYRAELASLLQRRLGIRVERDGAVFRIPGIDGRAIQAFSSRRRQVLDVLRERQEAGALAAKRAALFTRASKNRMSPDKLFATWLTTGVANGFGRAAAEGLLANPARGTTAPYSIADALNEVTKAQSHFPIRDLVRRACERAVGTGTDADSILDMVTASEQSLVPLGKVRGEGRFTTLETLNLERALLGTAMELAAQSQHPVDSKVVPSSGLSQEQQEAVHHLTRVSGDLALLLGLAGTGKTRLLGASRDVWEEAGYEVVGTALSGKAAAGLEAEARIPAQTLASLLLAVRTSRNASLPGPLSCRTICVLDEAGMVGTRQLADLVHECKRTGAKLVLVGDHLQLQPIEAGGPFRQLIETMEHARLTTIVRQQEEWAREAVRSISEGDGSSALSAFESRGQISVEPTVADASRTLVEDWGKDGSRNPKHHLILANEATHAALLNNLAQARRMQDRFLTGEPVEIPGGILFEGDRVLFLRNSRQLEVQNGLLGTVTATQGHHLVVMLDSGKTTTFDARHYPHISLGYAVTTHKAQGVTAEHVYALVGGSMQCRELSYVQVSRSRYSTRLFVDDANAGTDLAKLEDAMNESRPKLLATTILETADERVVVPSLR